MLEAVAACVVFCKFFQTFFVYLLPLSWCFREWPDLLHYKWKCWQRFRGGTRPGWGQSAMSSRLRNWTTGISIVFL